MGYFNYMNVALEAAIPEARLQELRETVRRDFPNDDMLFELHMLRACTAVRDGWIRIDDLCCTETIMQNT